MAITERTRHDLLVALEGDLGKEPAVTLAEHLPPVGWADVATRSDLDNFEQRLDLRFAAVDAEFAAVRTDMAQLERRMELRLEALEHRIRADLTEKFASQTRVMYVSIITTVLTLVGLSLVGG